MGLLFNPVEVGVKYHCLLLLESRSRAWSVTLGVKVNEWTKE